MEWLWRALCRMFGGCDEKTPSPPSPPPLPPDASLVDHLLQLHNEMRVDNFQPLLTLSAKLQVAAQKHANWMASTGYFSHTGQGGSSPFDRMAAEGYRYRAAGENIAYGQQDPRQVMGSWMNSSGHRRNILNKYFKEVGFGTASSRDGRKYWVACFGAPMTFAARWGFDTPVPLMDTLPEPLVVT